MTDLEHVHERLAAVQEACEALASSSDDAIRMFATRVDAMTRALLDSVVAPPDAAADE